jgi:hypothetical protein
MVFMIGGGNYAEFQNLQDWAKKTPAPNQRTVGMLTTRPSIRPYGTVAMTTNICTCDDATFMYSIWMHRATEPRSILSSVNRAWSR